MKTVAQCICWLGQKAPCPHCMQALLELNKWDKYDRVESPTRKDKIQN